MRFHVPLIVAAAALTSAAALPQPEGTGVLVSDGLAAETIEIPAELDLEKLDLEKLDLEKRQQIPSANAAVIGDHAGAAGQAVGRILNALLNKLFPLKDWTPARETFTKQTTALMWSNNPDRRRWVAVACYNKGWSVKNRGAISDVVSMELRAGAFHTNYDCMYIGRNNQFYTESDGGYINLAYVYDGSICSYDGRTGDLTCN